MDFCFNLTGICAMSPACPDTESFLARASSDEPFPALVPKMISRRLLRGDLLAVSSMLSLDCLTGLPEAVVFASMTGETPRCVRMLRDIHETGDVSPAEFSGSVHNSPSGYYAMISGCHASSSSVAGGTDTVAAGLSECESEIYGLGRRSVHAVFYENSLSGSLVNIPESFHGPFAVALSLERGSSVTVPGELVRHRDAVSLVRLLMKEVPGSPEEQNGRSVRCVIPCLK